MSDLRQSPRFGVDIDVTVTVADRTIPARTRDISRTGVCLITQESLPDDADIGLKLVLSFGKAGFSEPLEVIGRIAWCTPLFGSYQIGIRFSQVDDDREKYLDMFIGLLDGTLLPADGMDDDEPTEQPFDPDDPFRP